MNSIFKTLIGVVIAAALFLGVAVVQPQAYLPHERIVISLPFAPEYDASTSLIPMGETIYHPKPPAPYGHPGIDFGWDDLKVPIIASADGTVTKIDHGSSHGIDVTIRNGVYELRYKEMDEASLKFRVSQEVKKGDFIGYPAEAVKGDGRTHYQLHWEFASVSLVKDRFCPMTYFDSGSLARIEKIWAKVLPDDTGGMKRQFPDICSGDYAGKAE